ncbi:hypothetical protein [Hymenobacter sp. YC55]|uniref:hypothetical protein n=1 Tax=Hymenobacter sp. YC55 TaxID=3034019 RepID=UPI0023F7BAF9|nr:hypothetical protein [Hymenobacter sp. YC55]MDF7815358.1 hypothetical protein [Hymenobacter sp. YC55]
MLTESIQNSGLRLAATALETTEHMPWCEAINKLEDDALEAAVAAALAQNAQVALSVLASVKQAGKQATTVAERILKRPDKTTIAGFKYPIHHRRLRSVVRSLNKVGLRPYTLETSALPSGASDHEIEQALTMDAHDALHKLDVFEDAANQALALTNTYMKRF